MWQEVSVRCERAASEAVIALCLELSGGVAIDDPLDATRDRERWDYSDLKPGDPRWVTVTVYLAGNDGVEKLVSGLERIRALGLGIIEGARARRRREEEWAEAWKAYYKPIKVGKRLVVVPEWEEYAPGPGELIVRLDPGMAFGTGSHPTTALCLRWLEDLVPPHRFVCDIGTGSGILATAAALLGAERVLAVDVDAQAVRKAEENLDLNGEAAWRKVSVVHGEFGSPFTEGWLASTPPDLVVANIVAGVIVPLCPRVAHTLRPGGRFLASGILSDKMDEVVQAMQAAGLRVADVREEEGWAAILAVGRA